MRFNTHICREYNQIAELNGNVVRGDHWDVTLSSTRLPTMSFDGLEGVVLHLHLLSCVIQSDQNAYRTRSLNRPLERLTLVITDRRKSDLIHDLNTIAFAGKLIPFVIN